MEQIQIRYLKNVSTLEELRRAYYREAKLHHPDIGGDTEIMKQINAEFEYLGIQMLANPDFKDWEKKREYETMEHFVDIIDQLINIVGVDIEIIGVWLWVTGNTYPSRDKLKEAGLKFSTKKSAWYWHTGHYRKRNKKFFNLEDIREMFGTQRVQRAPKANALST
jgi:hypothetical protein